MLVSIHLTSKIFVCTSVYCLLAKETLIYDAGVAPTPSFLLSNVLPWILVALTYNGKHDIVSPYLRLIYCK